MQVLNFEMVGESGTETRRVEIANLVIAGWTGRDAEAIEKHIAELEAIGVARPPSTPCFYRASANLLTTAEEIEVIGGDSSGEIEFVLVSLEDGLWVGLGSDHTDRKVEAFDVTVSKQMCAKPVAPVLWRFDDLADHWDELLLQSHAVIGGTRTMYQEGRVAAMLPPAELIARYPGGGGELPAGTLMFCGTLAVHGGVRPADAFEVSLFDPARRAKIDHHYRIKSLPAVEQGD